MAKNEHGTSLASIEEGVTVTGNVKEKAAHLAVRQGDQRSSEQMDEQGGSNWPKFEDADWPAGGEDKPSGWAFRTKRQDSRPNLKPPIDQQGGRTKDRNGSCLPFRRVVQFEGPMTSRRWSTPLSRQIHVARAS